MYNHDAQLSQIELKIERIVDLKHLTNHPKVPKLLFKSLKIKKDARNIYISFCKLLRQLL